MLVTSIVTEIWNQSVCKIAILLLQQNIGTSSYLPNLGAERAVWQVSPEYLN